ncbi:MAG TPA: molybdenum cofactor guanylyltransferase [Pyrinomonadaceae bacterium]
MTSSIQGFVLIGGRSSRMGTDKAALIIDGQTLIQRVTTALSSITSSIRLVGNKSQPTDEFQIVLDRYEQWGALGGLHAALSVCGAEWAAVVACDLPFVTSELFERLANSREDFEAVAPIQRDKIPQPLCSLYRIDPCLSKATELIESGERRPIALLQSVRTRWISFDQLSDLEGADHFFDNINTPEDYMRAQSERSQLPR